jgi:hypothetical protein
MKNLIMENNNVIEKIEDVANGMASVARVQEELIGDLKKLVEELALLYSRYENNKN